MKLEGSRLTAFQNFILFLSTNTRSYRDKKRRGSYKRLSSLLVQRELLEDEDDDMMEEEDDFSNGGNYKKKGKGKKIMRKRKQFNSFKPDINSSNGTRSN